MVTLLITLLITIDKDFLIEMFLVQIMKKIRYFPLGQGPVNSP